MDSTNPLKPADEITIRCRKNTKEIYSKYFLSDRERKELIGSLGDAACMLFEYYLRMAAKGDVELCDQHSAEYFGWNLYKVKRNRLALSRAGWFRQVRSTFTDGRRGLTYYIGEDAVRESQRGTKP